MREMLYLLASLALCTALSGCGQREKSPPAAEPPAPEMTAPVSGEEAETFVITVGEHRLTVDFAANSSAAALRALLEEGPLTLKLADYGGFEKVGPLGVTLPRNDEPVTTEPGDVILYQGNQITIYYAENAWTFTRLGRVREVSAEELKELLGAGDVTVTLSLAAEQEP